MLSGWTANADMAELADALVLGSSVHGRAGSSPVIRTSFTPHKPSVYAGLRGVLFYQKLLS